MSNQQRRYSQLSHLSPVQNPAGRDSERPEAFESFGASELYCPKCQRAMPVRERMLLVLPSGDLFEYTCVRCHTSLGTRRT